jgi:flagellar biosynthetic protein FliR
MEVYVGQFVVFVLLLVRTTSLIVTAPILGHQAVPFQIKVGLGLFLAFVLFPLQSSLVGTIDLKLLGIVLIALQEIIVGITIGFGIGLVFAGVRYAGELIGYDMGFSIAASFDPETNASVPVIGEVLYTFTALIFILLNGHHFVLEALTLSYGAVPIGQWSMSSAAADKFIGMVGLMFAVAVKFAAPAIVALFLTNIALAVLTRMMPQMNIFGVAFPLKIGVGIVVLSASFPVLVLVFKKVLSLFENSVLDLVKVL